jgi:hypothetical protein
LAEQRRQLKYEDCTGIGMFGIMHNPQFVPVKELERKASRRNAGCEIESFVDSFRGSIVAVRWLSIPSQVPPLSKSDREGGEPKLIYFVFEFRPKENHRSWTSDQWIKGKKQSD